MDNLNVHQFIHSGTRHGTGEIRFTDTQERNIATIPMQRDPDGLWFMSTEILLPEITTKQRTIHNTIHQMHQPIPLPNPKPTNNPTPSNKPSPDTPSYKPNPDPPSKTQTRAPRTNTWNSNLSKAVKQLEIWHQRLGHPAPSTLRNTSKVVEGIPTLPSDNSFFRCPFCDLAKLHKTPSRKSNPHEQFLPGTTFHMDVGFIRGPNNLQDIITHGATPKQTVQLSHDGYSAYLLIIDAATRYIFTFLLKSRHPPIDIIDKFLQKYGQAKQGHLITTNPNGILSKSNSFEQLCQDRGYTRQQHLVQYIMDMHPSELASEHLDQIQYKIRTDNGTDLATSEEFRKTASKHNYIVEPTAPASSSQNGLAERPHKTLKDRVRCLLYSAGLGIEFWSDALLHSVWLYNRTYHTALEDTPYRKWTGRTPTLDGLLTFGAKITSKKSKDRPTAADPNAYNGIFLGYKATMQNIVYWDTSAQRKRTAKHIQADEFQYGSPPSTRSPSSKHLLEVHTDLPHALCRSDIIHEPPIIVAHDNTTATNTPQSILDNNPLPHTAAAAKAKFERPPPEHLLYQLQQLDVTLNPYETTVTEQLPLHGNHPTLGLEIQQHSEYADTVSFIRCIPGTVAHKNIRNWKSRLKGNTICMIDDHNIHNPEDITRIIRQLRRQGKQYTQIKFAKPKWHSTSGEGLPILHFDQLNVIMHHLQAIETGDTTWNNPLEWPNISEESLQIAISKGISLPRLTRRKVKQMDEWPQFLESEWTQLNKYHSQKMFGEPCPRPKNVTVLPWVWTYLFKMDPVTFDNLPKSRGTCNGANRPGRQVTLAETYAACVEQPVHRLTWAIIAALNYVGLGCDISNAFAEAPGPKQQYYMKIDAPFREWWTKCLGRDPSPDGYVLPVLRNLQGHPEGPRLWHKYIDNILVNELGYDHTSHEPCLYFQHHKTHGLILILRQVDDFLIGARNIKIATEVKEAIEKYMTNPVHQLGIIKRFNGMDVEQTKHFIKITCEKYITKIIEHHGWTKEPPSTKPLPMRTDASYMKDLELSTGPTDPHEQKALEKAMGFNYRQVIGECIFAMTLCRVDIAPAIIKLSQYSTNPAKCHYDAARMVMMYLWHTRSDGIYYWRPDPNPDLPDIPLPEPVSSLRDLEHYFTSENARTLHGCSDATWASDRQHRRSTGGIVFFFAGGAVYYRTRIHPTIAQSSTEAELQAMTDAGKAALYLRSILEELNLEQTTPTQIHVDNRAARQFSNAQQPTRRTRHIDMRDFVIMQWTEEEKIIYKDVASAYNPSDSISKPTGRTKFYQQNDIIMGRHHPQYIHHLRAYIKQFCSTYDPFHLNETLSIEQSET